MRKILILAVVASMAFPCLAASRRVTVDQLQQFLSAQRAANKSDSDLATQLGSLELTEQLTPPALSKLVAAVKPGPNTCLALDILAEASTFLEPPAAELPAKAAPDAAAQRSMMSAAIKYVTVTQQRLPNFLATRVTRSFDDIPAGATHSGYSSQSDLHLAGTFRQETTYRDGREIASHTQVTSSAQQKPGATPPGLVSRGEFGPILATILMDSAKGTLTWSHWEQTPVGLAAVFHYAVPQPASHYAVDFCCVKTTDDETRVIHIDGLTSSNDSASPGAWQDASTNSYHGTPGYHGSLYLDPDTGAILRVTLQSELKSSNVISRADIAVQYGKVDIGGSPYICPVRSVAISRTQSHSGGDMSDRTIERINEIRFTDYHRFAATTRIITDAPAQ